MRTASVLALLFLALCLTGQATADVVYVDLNAPGPDHDGTSWDTAFLTIQEGVDAATPGGEVWVADGTYVENVVMGEGVAIYGGFLGAEEGGYETELEQRDFVNNVTAIDGNQSGSCVVMAVDARVDGFTLTNGSGTYEERTGRGPALCGGGIYALDLGDTGVIANNTLADNTTGHGGAIYLNRSSPSISDNAISENHAGYLAGGIYCYNHSSPAVVGNTVVDNFTWNDGGGILCEFYSSPTVTDNTITGNSAGAGAGVYCAHFSSPRITGNTISYNSGTGVSCDNNSDARVEDNIISSNTSTGVGCARSSPVITGNIISGNAAEAGGSGVSCGSNATPFISLNTITGNFADWSGGGISCRENSLPTITSNVITANSAEWYGGGIYCWDFASPTVANNIIAYNTAAKDGGGIYCREMSWPTVTNNTIVRNQAFDGGGLFCSVVSSPTVMNNIVAENTAFNLGGGVYSDETSIPQLMYNDFWQNTPDDYYGCEAGEGSISADPMFVDPDAGDFHLQPGSPCIDRGRNEAPELPRTDYDGDLRILDGDSDEIAVVDIGADEFAPDDHVVTIIDLPTESVTIDEDTTLEFAGTAYYTGELAIVAYLWNFGEGSGIPDMYVEDPGEVVFGEPGIYVVTFDAQDENGAWCPLPDARTVTVDVVPPDAVIDSPTSDLTIYMRDYVEFAGTATDANGEILDWLWNFGEGSGIPDMHVEDPGFVQFNNPGIFCVTFDAQDNDGHWDPDPDTRAVHVRGAPMVYVDVDSPGPVHDGSSWDTALLTIQEGVNAVTPDGEAWVANGIYYENVVLSEGVAIYGGFLGAEPGGYETSIYQRDYVGNVTTVDGGQAGSCVVAASDSCVDGFHITNGSGTLILGYTYGGGILCHDVGDSGTFANNTITQNAADYGGGVGCLDHSSPAISYSIIANNSADQLGGGIGCCNRSSPAVSGNEIHSNAAADGGGIGCLNNSSPAIAGNTMFSNQAGEGAAVYCYDESSPTITGNSITDNLAAARGGGIYCWNQCSPAITDNMIAGNSAQGGDGGGVYCQGSCAPAITGNTIADNWASDDGGGIFCDDWCSPSVGRNTIAGNAAGDDGGGICYQAGISGTVSDNIITGNSAVLHGGGLRLYDHCNSIISRNVICGNRVDPCVGGGLYMYKCDPVVTDNTICDNYAAMQGGAIYFYSDCKPTLTNNTIAGNYAPEGGAFACNSYSQSSPNNVLIANCIVRNGGNEVWNNDGSTIAIIYSNVEGGWAGEGNFDADPMFVDPIAGDWHLTFESPCIDAGTNDAPDLPETDWDGEDRISDGIVDIGADEYFTLYTEAPDLQPEGDGPLFGGSQSGFPAWVWFSIPLTPDCVVGSGCADPSTLLGFECDGRLWYWDKYGNWAQVYQPPFVTWDLAVGESYLLYLETDVANPSYEGITPLIPWTFDFKLGRMGWTWVGMPGLAEVTGDDFMSSVTVKYPSDDTGEYRSAQQDYDTTPDNWISWGWPYWNTWLQAPETFTPYAPFGHNTCYPWVGYRAWVNVGTAMTEDEPDQVTLIWPKVE